MIQRIQSIYLFLAAVLTVGFSVLNDYVINFASNLPASLIDVLSYVVAVLSIVALFMFKNRKLQINISQLGILLALVCVGVYIYVDGFANFYKDWQFYMLLLSIFALVLARRGVKHDEDLIKSSYRLR